MSVSIVISIFLHKRENKIYATQIIVLLIWNFSILRQTNDRAIKSFTINDKSPVSSKQSYQYTLSSKCKSKQKNGSIVGIFFKIHLENKINQKVTEEMIKWHKLATIGRKAVGFEYKF